MAKLKATTANSIYDVQVTNDCLASRAGLNLFALDKHPCHFVLLILFSKNIPQVNKHMFVVFW